MTYHHHDSIRAVEWANGALKLLDQRLLPQQRTYVVLENVRDTAQAITDMVVRGAPAIGVTAAYGVVLAARACHARSPTTWKCDIEADLEVLACSRPTAVNLFWALDRMRGTLVNVGDDPYEPLLAEARRIHEEDIAANRHMGHLGAALIADSIRTPGASSIQDSCAVLTHCNTGSLATGGYGTALGVIRAAYAAGSINQVFADETRPWMQGARLTAWELVEDNIPVTLVVEGAGAHLMKQGVVHWVIVGADRIAANGDTANKIGTYNLAVVARYHGVKFMVVAPTSTIDMTLSNGAGIPIEVRSTDEILSHAGHRVAAQGAAAWNPAFDVTPATLIDAIVTERGIVLSPTPQKMAAMMRGGRFGHPATADTRASGRTLQCGERKDAQEPPFMHGE